MVNEENITKALENMNSVFNEKIAIFLVVAVIIILLLLLIKFYFSRKSGAV